MFNQLHKNKTRGSEHNDLRIEVATFCNNHLIEKHTNSRSYYNGPYTINFVRSNTLDHILLKIVEVIENVHKVTLNIVRHRLTLEFTIWKRWEVTVAETHKTYYEIIYFRGKGNSRI